MANIDEYIKQIQQARYGEEVRDSIVNALKKVNDDNNSYVAIKKEVVAAKDIVEEKAEIFDEKANAAKETLTALQASTQIANEAKSSLNNIISSAISTKKELEQAVLETGEVIARVDNAKSNLDKSITSAGKAELNLQRQIETSNQIKNQLDVGNSTAIELKKNLDMAINEANTAKVKLVEAINNAGNTAVENIENAQNTATQAVETAKAEAIKTVADKGKEVLEAIPNFDAKLDTKLDKNQGAEHAGKALVVGEDGNVVPGEVQTEGVGDAADAIVNTASGTLLNIKDSAERKNKGFGMSGKTEQVQTSGKNLANPSEFVIGALAGDTGNIINLKQYITTGYIPVIPGKRYSTSCGNKFLAHAISAYDKEKTKINSVINMSSEMPEGAAYIRLSCKKIDMTNVTESDMEELKKVCMVNEGSTVLSYEPYTGGKPSPSPEYPQEIINAGKLNEDTGKYEVDVKVTGKNIVNIPDFGADTPDTVKECYISKNICISAQEKADASKSIWRFKALHKDGSIEHITDAALPGCFYATEENPIVSITYRAVDITSGAYKGIMVEYGTAATKYEPYKEQTLTLTSDRPLTKWDRLTEQNGQIGWLYNSAEILLNGTENWIRHSEINKETTQAFGLSIPDLIYGEDAVIGQNGLTDKFRYVNAAWAKDEAGQAINNGRLFVNIEKTKASTVEEFKAWLKSNNVKVVYKTKQTEFVPLLQSEQDAIRALQTYYPTTVVSNSEDMEMELSYVADTKNYTDRKIEQAVSAQVQNLANLLSLMPLSTQAAMIEADTNNILDMEVQK